MAGQPEPVWAPSVQDTASARVSAFADDVSTSHGYRGSAYLDLWRWLPHTVTGKKPQIPVERILVGHEPEDVVDLGAVDRPDVLNDIAALAAVRSPG
jgi:hypothetical protein